MNKGKDILVIDDEPVVAQAVVKVCASEGLSAEATDHAAEGLALVAAGSYRLVLCDILMPDLDGFQFLAAASRRAKAPPIVMTTGFSTVENAVHSLSCGAADFLPKPFTADELIAVVRRGLRLEKLRRDAAFPGAAATIPPPYVRCPVRRQRLGFASWVLAEPEGTALIGVTDLFLKMLQGVRTLDLAPVGEELVQGRVCATIGSIDGCSHGVLCPLSGRIVEADAAAKAAPSLVEKDPYFAGWLYRILPSDPGYELAQLSPGGSAEV
jgi:DNA-binding response OmpR family regulator